MMRKSARTPIRLAAVGLLAVLASCATPAPPPPPPAPPPPAPIPARPTPPDGASPITPVPPLGVDGVRQSVNARLSPAGTTWNLRSGLNVAALNCLEARHAPILEAYKALLKGQQKKLAATNKAVEAEFRDRFGARAYLTERDQYLTQVYNYFALPPVRERFCGVATEISANYLLLPPKDLDAYAAVMLPRLEAVFSQFYDRFDAYRLAVADWDARYGAAPALAQPARAVPAALTLPGAPAATVPQGTGELPALPPASGAQPAIKGTPSFVSAPVVQQR